MSDKYFFGDACWTSPDFEPPPTDSKLLLLTPGGTCVVGHWAHWCVAWSPLPKISEDLKEKLNAFK